MLPVPSADYAICEAKNLGKQLAVRATFLPYPWPPGVNADGDFSHSYFRQIERIQFEFEYFTGGYWISEVRTSNIQLSPSTAIFTWDWNYPGFDVSLYWRAADTTAELAVESWTEVFQGSSLEIKAYYQLKAIADGYRCWIEEEADTPDDGTAWIEADASPDAYQGYAANNHVAGDDNCYIENLILLGEFTVVRDIEQAGTITQEAPRDFSDLVSGSHDGLILNNRQRTLSWDGIDPETLSYTPTPLFSPGKSSFFLAHKSDWYGTGIGDGLKLRIDIGWNLGGFLSTPFLSTPFLVENFTDFLTLYLGKVDNPWEGNRSVDENGVQSANVVKVTSKDFILDCLQKKICLPAVDGTPQPLTLGEFLVKGKEVSGWSPAPIIRSAYFAQDNYNELDHVIATGGGAFSLITPGIVNDRAIRFATTGANQTAYASIILSSSGEMFPLGTMRFTAIPATISNLNFTFMQIIDSTGSADLSLSVDSSGNIYSSLGGQTDFNILGYEGVPLSFAVWLSPTNPGYAKLFINGDEVLTYTANLSGDNPIEFRFGAQTGAVAETWTVDFEGIEIKEKYYLNAYRVLGAPFAGIGPVYMDNIAQPASKTVGVYVQTLTKYPEYGLVQITSTDPDFSPSGDILIRVIENAGGRHALYGFEVILEQIGLTDYIDADALAAAYAAVPNDIINMRFESEADQEKYGLKDYASMGIPAADCLKEILSRMMYWLFIDAGTIKIVPYTGTAPTDPAMAFTATNMHEAVQRYGIGNEDICAYVTAIYGWYDRNPSLYYVVGNPASSYQGRGLDYSWGNSPVVCESASVVKSKTDLLFIFLSAKETIDPLRTKRFEATRLELMTDTISINDVLLHDTAQNYRISRKVTRLDIPREVILTPISYKGES